MDDGELALIAKLSFVRSDLERFVFSVLGSIDKQFNTAVWPTNEAELGRELVTLGRALESHSRAAAFVRIGHTRTNLLSDFSSTTQMRGNRMDTDFEHATIDIATDQGDGPFNADVTDEYCHPRTGVQAVTVVDGIGHNAEVAKVMQLLASVAVRVGAREGVRTGLLAATFVLADPLEDVPNVNGVMVLAELPPGEPATVAHVGDSRCWSWSDGALHQHTMDHTIGEELRQRGVADEAAARHDHKVVTTIARANQANMSVVGNIYDQQIFLTSDGVHKALTHSQLTEIIGQHATEPKACAEALVAAARAAGSRDDATAVVITRPAPIPYG
jgi:serine/threonine protein phosphatase PrpC